MNKTGILSGLILLLLLTTGCATKNPAPTQWQGWWINPETGIRVMPLLIKENPVYEGKESWTNRQSLNIFDETKLPKNTKSLELRLVILNPNRTPYQIHTHIKTLKPDKTSAGEIYSILYKGKLSQNETTISLPISTKKNHTIEADVLIANKKGRLLLLIPVSYETEKRKEVIPSNAGK